MSAQSGPGFSIFVFGNGVDPFAQPNTGNSAHLRNGANGNVIGGFSIGRNNFSNDFLNGVLIDGVGTDSNVVRDTDIGRATFTGGVSSNEFAGNGMNGVAIMGGASDNLIGSRDTDLRVEIDASPDAGILIDGSDHNDVVGCFLGQPFSFVVFGAGERNRIGVHIRNGAKGNRIGEIGPLLGPFVVSNLVIDDVVDSVNFIEETEEVGIWIEDAGGTLDFDGTRLDPNVIQNNTVGSEGVGLKISGTSKVNDIGGFKRGPTGFFQFSEFFTQEDNFITGKTAGLLLENVNCASEEERNRFLNNTFSSETDSDNPQVPEDLTAGPPPGVGVLITGPSEGIIIGETLRAPNFIISNRVGVYIDGANNNVIRGNFIGQGFTPNSLSGVVINNGEDNEIGGPSPDDSNIFEANGLVGFFTPSDNPHASGILIAGGQRNVVRNNEILETRGDGVFIQDSIDNVIGGPSGGDGNMIIDGPFGGDTRNGIAISGAGSSANTIQNNRIGVDRAGAAQGNNLDGIDISNGASNNLIGGSGRVSLGSSSINISAGNTIANNSLHGVHVSGGGTVGNSILNNSIFGNGGLGIENEAGGNDELPPPVDLSYGEGTLTGDVTDVLVVPEGSIVDVFSDQGTQGDAFLGRTEVKSDGSFIANALFPTPFPNITATVTHAISGSTSEFALADSSRSLTLARLDGQPPGAQDVTFGVGDIKVLVLGAEAVGDSVIATPDCF